MYKTFLIATLLLFLGGKTMAQYGEEMEYKEYDDLLLLYMDEKYEKIIKKCEGGGLFPGIIEKERQQPLPYLYMAKAYYEISKMEKYQEEYSRAFKEALKYAGRFVDKDEKNKFLSDHQRFLSTLRADAIEIGKVLYEKAEFEPRNYRKSRYYFEKIARFSPNDPSPHYMVGLTNIKQGIERMAERAFEEGHEKYKKLESLEDLRSEQQELFKFFLNEYSAHLIDNSKRDSARATLKMGHPFYKGDEDYDEVYDRVF